MSDELQARLGDGLAGAPRIMRDRGLASIQTTAVRLRLTQARIAELEEMVDTLNAGFQASEVRLAQARECIRRVAALVDPVRDLHPDYSVPSIRQAVADYYREVSHD